MTGSEKHKAYKNEYGRYKKAMEYEFYLEAVSILYSIMEDRLISFLHHSGVVTRNNEKLEINKSVKPFIRELLNKEPGSPIKIKDISVKMNIISFLLEITDERANEIDFKVCGNKKSRMSGYMVNLKKYVNRLDHEIVQQIFTDLNKWRENRNQLIHALMNKPTDTAFEMKKTIANDGYKISRNIDNYIVKPFKKNNRLRVKYYIQ